MVFSQNRNSLILTFGRVTLPETINLCFEIFKVRPFIPKPRRCFKVFFFSFKHLSNGCNKKECCFKCGSDKHDGECTAPVKCVNCRGNHFSTSISCPNYTEQYKIIEMHITQKIPFYQAQQMVNQLTQNSYAKSLKPNTFRSISTQTCSQNWDTSRKSPEYPLEPKITIRNSPLPTTPASTSKPTTQDHFNKLNSQPTTQDHSNQKYFSETPKNRIVSTSSEMIIDPDKSETSNSSSTESHVIHTVDGGLKKRKCRKKKPKK